METIKYPLSLSQQDVIYDYLMNGKSPKYNIGGKVFLKGHVDIDLMARAVVILCEFIDVLGLKIQRKDSDLYALFTQPSAKIYSYVDVSSEEQSELSAQAFLDNLMNRCSDLFDSDLVKVCLLKLSEKKYWLVGISHHIAVDGIGGYMILSIISRIYECLRSGADLNWLNEIPSYRFQLEEQQNVKWKKRIAKSGEYWNNYFESEVSSLIFRKIKQTEGEKPTSKALSYILSKELYGSLTQLSNRYGFSIQSALMAALSICYGSSESENTFCFGVSLHKRLNRVQRNTVGMFSGVIPCKVNYQSDCNFVEFSQSIQKQQRKDYFHAALPLRDIKRLAKGLGEVCGELFEVVVNYERFQSTIHFVGIETEVKHLSSNDESYPLAVRIIDYSANDKAVIKYDFRTDYLQEEEVSYLHERLLKVFEEALNFNHTPIGLINKLGAREQEQLLLGWNNTERCYSQEVTIHKLFENQASTTPDLECLKYENSSVTFSQLNRSANKLANHLIAEGVQIDKPIGVFIDRSVEMVVSILAILKSGAAYLPIETSQPVSRIKYYIDDADLDMVLTTEKLLGNLPEEQIFTSKVRYEIVDRVEYKKHIEEESDNTPHIPELTSNSLAYVIYTSGSIGLPKGVMIEHTALVNRIAWMQQRYSLNSSDRVLHKTPLGFDVSVWELFWPLTVGAPLVIAKPEGHKSPDYLQKLIIKEQITTLHFVPSMLTEMLDTVSWNQCKTVERVMCSGEALSSTLQERFFQTKTQSELHNLYGPTEASIDVTAWQCRPTSSLSIVPIGKPINNIRLYVLDEGRRLVPIGASGELYIGGIGLARGYINNTELTEKHYITIELQEGLSERLYKTGDLVRYLPSGDLEYIGRRDQQVKLNGVRVETGEIEYHLNNISGVKHCLVTAAKNQSLGQYLIAYVVLDDDLVEGKSLEFSSDLAENESGPKVQSFVNKCRSDLSAVLPQNLIPSYFIPIAAIPTTINGKVNRKNLPLPSAAMPISSEIVKSETDLEKIILAVWCEVFNVESLSVTDIFFNLGGQSILAMRMVTQLSHRLGVLLELNVIFDNPTVKLLAKYIMEFDTSEMKGVEKIIQSIPLIDRSGLLPLSFAQKRLWFLDQYQEHGNTYHMPGLLRLKGVLNEPALAGVLSSLVERHEALRTNFIVDENSDDKSPHQVIGLSSRFELTSIELKESDLAEWIRLELLRPFDLQHELLFRASICRISDREYYLLVNIHHIVSDGWSVGVVIREIVATYNASCKGESNPLAPLSIQYGDYAAWQNECLSDDLLTEKLAYWTKQLEGVETLELPTTYPRPAEQSHRGDSVSFSFDKVLTESLMVLSQSHEVTLFMTLLSGFSVLMQRYCHQEDITIGTPIANRQRVELEDLVGLFVNTLVLRVDLTENPTFVDLLERVRQTTLDAYEHQDVPFEKVVDAVSVSRDRSHSPLFQVMFVLQNTPQSALEIDDLEISLEALPHESAKFDLTMTLTETETGIGGSIEYATDLFSEVFISSMTVHFKTLLADLVENSKSQISVSSLLTETECHHLLDECNQTKVEYPLEKTIHQLFEEQVENTPEQIAVVYEDEHLTYSQLNKRSNQLAHHLISLGVEPDCLVAICVERSLDMIVGLLAILKAGGAYVPIDPTYPRDRIAYMLKDSDTRWILSQSGLENDLQSGDSLFVSIDRFNGSSRWQHNPVVSMHSNHLAYVIYTSGSTGQPKGVMIEHSNIVNFLTSMAQYPGLQSTDTLLALTPISFDIHTLELYLPLIVGAILTVASYDDCRSPLLLGDLIRRCEASVIQATPATWAMLSNAGWVAEQPIRILCGGEAINEELKKRMLLIPSVTLHNMYGPTETTVWSSTTTLDLNTKTSIGTPINNTQFYIFDTNQKILPQGVAGELHIGGAGLARGYLNRPELTREKFIDNPFSPGSRLYSTGDLARLLEDGNVEYLGRLDDQVKVRGFRIETGEIAHQLTAIDGVEASVVLATALDKGNKALIAYVVKEKNLKSNEALDIVPIRVALSKTLPDYMLPSAVVIIDAIPLTENGKVNKKVLQKLEFLLASSKEYVAPRTATEVKLVQLFEDVLTLDRVGIEDDFFEIGGHSLLATQLISKIKSQLSIELPLKALFETPTVAGLQHTLKLQGSITIHTPITVLESKDNIPLSFAQDRLWFLDQYEGSNTTYHIPGLLRIEGVLNQPALAEALSSLVEHHEALRTNFIVDANSDDTAPRQVIGLASRFELTSIELDNGDLAEWIRVEHQRPFDLQHELLFRAILCRISDSEHYLLVNMHHIVSDGWSVGVVIRDIVETYKARCKGDSDPLTPLPIQYCDYAVWQKEYLSGDLLKEKLAYWSKQLEGLETLELPTTYPRPAEQSYRGNSVSFSLDTALTDSLKVLSQSHGVTLFMTLLGGFSVLMQRYSQQENIAIGTPVANRQCAELEDLVGLFVNTLVVRVDLTENPSFVELLDRVRKTTLEAYEHQEVPFEKIVEVVSASRDRSHSPLFQVMFVLQNTPQSALDVDGLEINLEALPHETAKFDLTMTLTETEMGLEGSIEYATDLFSEVFVSSMTGHFKTLLAELVDNSQSQISTASLLTKVQRHHLLVERNQTELNYPQEKTIHQLFEEQVERTPENIAVAYEDEQLTYAQLNKRSNQLAHYLISQGVEPDSLVAICVERSLDMMVGLLGILKAGGAYVPIDPTYPRDRIAYMVKDSATHWILSQSGLEKHLQDSDSLFISIDRFDGSTHGQHNPVVPMHSNHLVYVIYTSGSTGQPKGVMTEHISLVNRLDWMQKKYGVGQGDSILQKTPYCFDVSVWELFWPLLNGCRQVVAKPDGHKDNQYLTELIKKEKITTLHFVPSMLNVMLQDSGLSGCESLEQVICSGEALSVQIVAEYYAQLDAPLYNLYGPTEAAIDVSSYECCIPDQQYTVPIGLPIQNIQLHILDKSNQPVPYGITGELHIGGACLARGYLNKPELSKEKFIDNPFNPGSRLYKTGDLVRYLEDGNIEYLGRLDEQVKIRGFRIETGEIEQQLVAIEGVKASVVLVSVLDSGEKALIAYVVEETNHNSDKTLDIISVKSELSKTLPDYMLPSAMVMIDAIPLTPNGKVDKKSLLRLEFLLTSSKEYVAPRTATEEKLVQLFEEILMLDIVGVEDNFFELGGHSLLATQLISKIRSQLSLELPLKAIFENPTVAGLQKTLILHGSITTQTSINVLENKENISLSFAQDRLWFLDQYEENSSTYHIPGLLRLDGVLNQPALAGALSSLVERHETLRTNFIVDDTSDDKSPRQVIGSASRFELTSIELEKNCLDEWIRVELQRSFDLQHELLFRASLCRISDSEHYLLVNMHHIVSDGWSVGVVIKEIAETYKTNCKGVSEPLAPLSVQYSDYAAWQREYLSGELLKEKLAYWGKQLEGLETLELPTTYPRPAEQSYRGSSVPFKLNKALTDSIKALSQRHGVTLFMTLLSGFSVLMQRYSQQEDISIGTPVANRQRAELENLVGFFVNSLVLRLDLTENPSFVDLLDRVRQTTLDAYEYQDVPFEKIVDAVSVSRDRSHSPLFQVMFVLQNTPQSAFELDDLEISLEVLPHESAKFDLTMTLTETDTGIEGSIEYATDLFSEVFISSMTGHFKTLLADLVDNSKNQISAASLLTETECHQLLVERNQTEVDYPKEKTIHQLFEEQVEKTPDNIAVVYEDQELTYAQLNSRSNQVAHYLISLGVEPDSLVAICVERSLDMIVGLLAILKAGGAYVPIDPTYPRDRIAYMLKDSDTSWILSQSGLEKDLPKSDIHFITIDRFDGCTEVESNPDVQMCSDHLGYVVYTSGTTGISKGVMVDHKSVVRLVINANFLDVMTNDVFLQLAPLAFDASTFEVWMPLLNGARLVVTSAGDNTFDQLDEVILKNNISVLWLTSALFKVIVEDNLNALSKLRVLLAGGDIVSFDTAKTFLDSSRPGTVLINGYGPTENTTFTTCYVVTGRLDKRIRSLPIGVPVSNTQVYVLDKFLKPVPVGVPGELYTSGAGLSRGYLNQPELTAEKFIKNPFNPDDRLYKTGDLVRYLEDGNIGFLGRLDDQVKVRGFRIETGEIEQQLGAIGGVEASVVLAKTLDNGDKTLVAYVVEDKNLNSGEALDIVSVKAALSKTLPDYMLPSAMVMIDAIPLTPNGKVDKKSLLRLEFLLTSSKEYVAPRTATEEKLVQLFEEILMLDIVGVEDNFFELGGHSLLATQLISKIRSQLSLELPLKAIFENPTVAGLQKTLILHGSITTQTSINVLENKENISLSFAQDRLWFLDQYEENSSTYHIPGLLRLDGVLNQPALAGALSSLVERHETLRTNFIVDDTSDDKSPRQVIGSASRFELTSIELEKNCLDEWIRVELQRSFDLQHELLFRASLCRISDSEHYLLVNMHHIVSDGWSVGVVIKEIAETYKTNCKGVSEPLAPLSVQYSDYAAWQREYLSGELLKEKLAYWAKQLEGVETLELPTTYPRPAEQSHLGDSVSFSFDKVLTDSLMVLSKSHEVTLFMTLLSGFSVLMQRYCQQEDITIGTPVANRQRVELEDLIGLFVNTLVLRVDLTENPSFVDLLERVRLTTLDAYEHQDVPFEKVVDAVSVNRERSHSPLFQVMFVLQNTPRSALELDDLDIRLEALPHASSKFDLTMTLTETEMGLEGSIEYATDLFSEVFVSSMTEHFKILLTDLVNNSQNQISAASLLSEGERHQLLFDRNQTEADYLQGKTIHQLFEEQVEKIPEHIAVVYEDEQLTYAQLNRRSNQLAHYLISLGVKADSLVAISVERSLDMIVGLLAILKAGGAYVPIDSTFPSDRIAYMLQDSRSEILLTQSELAECLPELNCIKICFDLLSEELELQPALNPKNRVNSNDLAYVIYTSGSTGKPKGVMVEHNSVDRLLYSTDHWFGFNERDVWTLFHSFSFDFAVWEIWGALVYGGKLVVVPYYTARDPEGFYQLLVNQQVTVLNQTSSAFKQLIQVEEDGDCDLEKLSLRYVIFGGEALDFNALKPWYQRHKENYPQLINMYGITETTVHVTYLPITAAEVYQKRGSLIGGRIPDLQLYILDRYLNPVPVGVLGELYVGGRGLSRGYLNQEALTAERFMKNPFDPEVSARLYKTGDMARYLSDGNIEYLGRLDEQVKIRGFRIETGEIEQQLVAIEGVKASVVLVKVFDSGEKALIAYVVENKIHSSDKNLEFASVKSVLSSALPDYMLPSAIALIDDIPLTPNGKVDKKALLAIEMQRRFNHEYVAPRDRVETAVANVFCDVLKVPQVGIYDNFFELGGDSIVSLNVVGKLKVLGYSLSVKDIFNSQSVSELAVLISENSNTEYSESETGAHTLEKFGLLTEGERLQLMEGTDGSIEDAYPASALQLGMLFHSELESMNGMYHDVFSYHLKMPWQRKAFETVLANLVVTHPTLRTGFSIADKRTLQIVNKSVPLPLSVKSIKHLNAQEQQQFVKDWVDEEKSQTFDWEKAPLFKVYIHLRNDGELQFTISFHHMILDGWSVATFIKELFAGYLALVHGRDREVESSPVPYSHFIELEERAIESAVTRCYWQDKLRDLKLTKLDNLNSSAQPEESEVKIKRSIATIENKTIEHISPKLKSLAKKLGVPVKSVLLAAHLRAIAFASGQYEVVTSVVFNGRTETEGSQNTLGLFLNSLPFRSVLAPQSWKAFINKVHKQEIDILPHRRFPLSQIQKLTGYEFSDILFNYIHFHVYNELMDLSREGDSRDRKEGEDRKREKNEPQIDVLDSILQEVTNFSFCAQFSQGLTGEINLCLKYDTSRFTPEFVERIAGYYSEIFYSILDDLEQDITEQSYLPNEEKEQLLVEFTKTKKDFISDKATVYVLDKYLHPVPKGVAGELFVGGAGLSRGYPANPDLTEERFIANPFKSEISSKGLDSYGSWIYRAGDLVRYTEDGNIDYVERIDGQPKGSILSYWKDKLAGIPVLHNLSLDFPRPHQQTFIGRTIKRIIDSTLAQRFCALCTNHSTTLYSGIHALFSVLLARHSGENETVFGTSVASRENPALIDLIGCVVNVVVMRTDLSGNPSFSELLIQTKQVTLEAYDNQHLPFELLINELVTERSPGHAPLFQIMLNVQSGTQTKLSDGQSSVTNIRATSFEKTTQSAKYDLTLNVVENNEGLLCEWEYNPDLFCQKRIEKMAQHFEQIMLGATDDPSKSIHSLTMLTEWEQKKILERGIQLERRVGSNNKLKLVHELFEDQVRQYPDRVAVMDDVTSLTYGEINERANQLAHYLRLCGVIPDTLVGLCVERDVEMIVSLLGILKSSAAFVAIDHRYPKQRIEIIIKDSQLKCVITQSTLKHKLPLPESVKCMVIDEDDIKAELNKQKKTNILGSEIGLVTSHLMHTIYTSGSTGRPKGVQIEHHSVVALLEWAVEEYSEAELGGVLASTSLCFDLSIFEIFAPLVSGGRVIVVENILYLDSSPNRNLVTLINSVPSAVATIIETEVLPSSVKVVNMAGEPIPPGLTDKIYTLGHVDRVYNLYGPSEDTTYTTYHCIQNGVDETTVIGRPIDGTQVYVLDSRQQLVPDGVVGELYISGKGLSRGYLHNTEMTVDKFVKNPFQSAGNSRLYKTGDRVRYRVDGNLEYLGRLDFQVKIRGFRIELGEIESILSKLEFVKQAIAVVVQGKKNEPLIVSYIRTTQLNTSDDSTCQHLIVQYLENKLPPYMVPNELIFLDAIPLTANGKLDRSALPPPKFAHDAVSVRLDKPNTEIELSLQLIWQVLLDSEGIGVNERFFDVGGTSLLLLKLQKKIRDTLDIEIHIVDLFQHTTIRALGTHLDGDQSAESTKSLTDYESRTAKRNRAQRNIRVQRTQKNIRTPVEPLEQIKESQVNE